MHRIRMRLWLSDHPLLQLIIYLDLVVCFSQSLSAQGLWLFLLFFCKIQAGSIHGGHKFMVGVVESRGRWIVVKHYLRCL